MKSFFSRNIREDLPIEEDFTTSTLDEDIKKPGMRLNPHTQVLIMP